MSIDEATTGFGSAAPRMEIPNSVSMLTTLRNATFGRIPPERWCRGTGGQGSQRVRPTARASSAGTEGRRGGAVGAGGALGRRSPRPRGAAPDLEVLPRRDPLDRPSALGVLALALRDDRAH